MTTTTSTLNTALYLTTETYTATLTALSEAAAVACPDTATKFARAAAAILAHNAPEQGKAVLVPMNLRRLNIVRRAIKVAVVVAFEQGDAKLGTAIAEVGERADDRAADLRAQLA